MKNFYSAGFLVLTVFVAGVNCQSKAESKSISDECFSLEEVKSLQADFQKNISKPGYLNSIAAAELKNNGELTGILTADGVRIARLSTDISFIARQSQKTKKSAAFKAFPINAYCVDEVVFSMPEKLRRQCDDNGAYGYFLTFKKQRNNVKLTSVGDAVGTDCAAVR